MNSVHKRVLIADDSRTIRLLARRILAELKVDVDEAENGEEALICCSRHMPDAVLLDRNMPIMDGMTFLEHLRKMPGGGVPVVVFCTTDNNIESISAALECGADEYIMKPFTADIVREKLQRSGVVDIDETVR